MTDPAPDREEKGSTSTVDIPLPRHQVFETLLDPRTYPDWLVGAKEIRAVDPDWPQVGSSFHHRVGVGPLRIADRTTIDDVQADERLELLARAGPLLSARVVFELRDGPQGGTRLRLHERPERGVLAHLWSTVGRSVMAASIWGRNGLSLERLKRYLETAPADR